MKRITGIIISAVALSAVGLSTISYSQMASSDQEKMQNSAMMMKGDMDGMKCMKSHYILKTAMRRLWSDHNIYKRDYITSALANLEDKDAVAKRLLKNQEEIGDAIKPFYGKDAGDKLTALLKDHILIAADVVAAAKADDKEALAKAQQKWSANADSIVNFLSTANPNWKKDDLSRMMNAHLEMTTGEVVSRLHKDWNADIAYFDKGYTQMMMFADYLTKGIIQQFPDKFKK